MVCLDLSKLTFKIDGKVVQLTKPQWRLLVDVRSQLGFGAYYESKDKMIEPTCAQLSTWIKTGKQVNTIRCDNAGETSSEKKCAQEVNGSCHAPLNTQLVQPHNRIAW